MNRNDLNSSNAFNNSRPRYRVDWFNLVVWAALTVYSAACWYVLLRAAVKWK